MNVDRQDASAHSSTLYFHQVATERQYNSKLTRREV